MRRLLPLIACIALIYSLVGSRAGLAQSRQSIGTVVGLQGHASVQRAGSLLPLQTHGPVYQDDVIRTLTGSKIKLHLLDGTELSLGEDASLTLSKLVYAPEQKSQNVLLRIVTGAFHMVTKSVLPQATFEVQTPTAVAAVRGTEWLGHVSAEATAIFVAQGQVAVRHVEPKIGIAVMVTAGMGTDVRGQSPPTTPRQWKAERVEALQKAAALP